MSSTAGGGATQTDGRCRPSGSGFKPGMVVQELGWDNDIDDELRVAIEDAIDADMVDGDYGNVVDAVLLWWRDDDGDLVDGLVDALTDLVGGGASGCSPPRSAGPAPSTPPTSPRPRRSPASSPDHHRRGQQGLDRHPAGRPQDARADADARRLTPALTWRALPSDAASAASGDHGEGARRAGHHPALRPADAGAGCARRSSDWGTGPAGGFAALAVRNPDRRRARSTSSAR